MEECQNDTNTIVLPKDTILYSGNTMSKDIITLQDIFQYVGQRGIEYEGTNFVLYASTNYDVAWGYASSCQKSGYIHKFKVTRDLNLVSGDIFEDAEYVAKCICEKVSDHTKQRIDGYAVIYSETQNEFALCNSSAYLQYEASIKCINDKNNWIQLDLQDYVDDVGIVGHDLINL